MIPPDSIPIHAAVDYSLQASKWQKCPLLIEVSEMKELLDVLGKFWIVQTSGLIEIGEEIVSRDAFLEVYRQYISSVKQGEQPTNALWRSFFSSVFTTFLEALYEVPINKKQCLIKIQQPVVQLQAHRFDYSFADGTFRSMVMGVDSIQWGIQFSYPHLYQDKNLQVLTTRESAQFPNTTLFKRLQQWVRSQTVATPFEVDGKRVNVPIRLGKQCFSWINTHPQLQEKGLRVVALLT
jgi:hypothetical protein